MSHRVWCCLSLWLFLLTVRARAEFYSSVDSMQDLGQLELELLNVTRSYLNAQQQQINLFRKFVEQLKLEHHMAMDGANLDDYLGHPLHAFRLIKRLVYDWDALHAPLVENKPREDYRQVVDNLSKEVGFPDLSELQGVVKGVARLQRVYNLTASDLADGIINGYFYDSAMDWRECYEIGVQLFDLGEHRRSLEWLQVAFNLLRTNPEMDEDDNSQFMADIREYAALANFELGNPKRAGRLLEKVLQAEPTHPAQHIRNYLDHREGSRSDQQKRDPSWFANYTRLCQGKTLPEKGDGSPLRCFLDGKRHAYFTLAPLQVEQVHLEPDINVYHGVLTLDQIDSIFEEADKLQMTRSGVTGAGGTRTVLDLRVSQQTGLDYESPIMKSIARLVAYISGFDMAGAEPMQVANYGVGGQYEPHPDYFEVNLPTSFKGDRISTSMFYLSNVEQGGYTVFTKLNVFLPPIKGALVMWHNLHRSLDVDPRTYHAGCPVIVGSKRIGNIWIHSGHQEFRRPCNLTSDSFKSAAYRKS
ncbi:prolyl 4-hydroxylase subunit alpha-1 [Drosophila guanche]|uniref:procollagen-proline 4-dioxygenase n=1 Tax=Drosophila guanche TaxID=7266 RepID=A0A3B0K2C8_DROGU|nr:prolyl 4-hydroxylase subunit alpha-1 [Drosophila guanche]SPP80109.1 blast:Prolyl 4-hydroxylase subunit alpha-1 [Drosophila guanche]